MIFDVYIKSHINNILVFGINREINFLSIVPLFVYAHIYINILFASKPDLNYKVSNTIMFPFIFISSLLNTVVFQSVVAIIFVTIIFLCHPNYKDFIILITMFIPLFVFNILILYQSKLNLKLSKEISKDEFNGIDTIVKRFSRLRHLVKQFDNRSVSGIIKDSFCTLSKKNLSKNLVKLVGESLL